MKSILMSIQPKWVEKIISGEKTIEVRKTAPKEVPFKVYIYCTKGKNGVLFKSRATNAIRLGFERDNAKEVVDILNNSGRQVLNGKVVAEFVVRNIESFSEWQHNYPSLLRHIDLYAGTEGDYAFLDNYLKGKKHGYAWHISDLKIYDEPKELGEFHRFCGNDGEGCPDADCPYYEEPSYEYGEITYDCYSMRPIARPPQSWQYVEELKE